MNKSVCGECKKIFSTKTNLNRHKREAHGEETMPVKYEENMYANKCLEGCTVSFRHIYDLRLHLKQEHNIDNEPITKSFPSYDDFTIWLKKEEEETNERYRQSSGVKRQGDGAEMKIYFNCVHSGKERRIFPKRDYIRVPRLDSLKLNRNCTSQVIIALETETGHWNLTYFRNHYRHQIECHPSQLRISNRKGNYVATKLNNILSSTNANIGSDNHGSSSKNVQPTKSVKQVEKETEIAETNTKVSELDSPWVIQQPVHSLEKNSNQVSASEKKSETIMISVESEEGFKDPSPTQNRAVYIKKEIDSDSDSSWSVQPSTHCNNSNSKSLSGICDKGIETIVISVEYDENIDESPFLNRYIPEERKIDSYDDDPFTSEMKDEHSSSNSPNDDYETILICVEPDLYSDDDTDDSSSTLNRSKNESEEFHPFSESASYTNLSESDYLRQKVRYYKNKFRWAQESRLRSKRKIISQKRTIRQLKRHLSMIINDSVKREEIK